MWYRYNDKLYNLKGIHYVEIEDTSIKLFPFGLVFYNKDMNAKHSILFETKFDAIQQLDIVEKLLNK